MIGDTNMPEPTAAFPDQGGSEKLERGIALCLSGGGYRAMVFHLGALARLNEAGLLPRIARVSSVSGGSITAGALALAWRRLSFDDRGQASNFDLVTSKVQAMADTTVDRGAIGWGILLPGSISERVAEAYDQVLFNGATLRDLPDDEAGEGPRFVFNATNVQTASLWRFSRAYMGDYRVGLVKEPEVPLATVVAASSAFPPVLSPMTLELAHPPDTTAGADLNRPPFTTRAVLSDGGVYDNLGLETAIKRYTTLLVSDGGQKIAAEESPAQDWARHSLRVLDVIDNQVRSLRRRQLIDCFERAQRGEPYEAGARAGAYWGIRTSFAAYRLATDPLGCAGRDPTYLAETPTRLEEMPRDHQRRLANWGYAICDAALRGPAAGVLAAEYGVTVAPPSAFLFEGGY
jgi:NTE family protein